MSHTHHHYVDGTMVIMHADGSAITPAECVECRFPGASTEKPNRAATYGNSCSGCADVACLGCRERSDAALAALYAPTTSLPLSHAGRAVAEELAREILDEPASPIARRIVAAERSRKCMDCGGEAKPAFGAGYRPDAPITSSMVVCRACRDKMVAESEWCSATYGGERCIKTRGHDGWHQTPGNVHITWPDPEPHEPEPERCNATYRRYKETVTCTLEAGHDERHCGDYGFCWKDGPPRRKPHVPARQEPILPPPQSTGRVLIATRADVERLTKEREEARDLAVKRGEIQVRLQGEAEKLRGELSVIKAEMLRLVGGAQ